MCCSVMAVVSNYTSYKEDEMPREMPETTTFTVEDLQSEEVDRNYKSKLQRVCLNLYSLQGILKLT